MPLPIKQYKHMFKDVKFLATTAQPSYKEVSHWIDLLEDPTQGDWYLPACGELGYIMSPFNKINDAINKMSTTYGSSVGVELNSSDYYHWSSTQYSSITARYVETSSGQVNSYNKNYYGYVRAWLRVKSDGTITSRKTTSWQYCMAY